MFTAKDIQIKVIDSASAKKIVKLYHYSGKTTSNSQIHFGVFLNNSLQGALQFGPSIDKRRMAQNLGIGFNESLELNRMALSDKCPKNSESRALGICIRMLKKQYPHLKVILSFADACQCGDGIIYRASGFKLQSFKKNRSLLVLNDGSIVSDKTLNDSIINGRRGSSIAKENGAKSLEGYQMKYLYFLDKELEKKFTFVEFKDIPKDIKMYKGIKCAPSVESGTSSYQEEGDGESPIDALQLQATD